MEYKYTVQRAKQKPALAGNWDNGTWADVQTLDIDKIKPLAGQPEHTPRTQAKLLYDDQNIYVIFRVEDSYVLAAKKNFDDHVCQDSCVEFFFTPGDDISLGYVNIEMNCGGTMLCHHQIDTWLQNKAQKILKVG